MNHFLNHCLTKGGLLILLGIHVSLCSMLLDLVLQLCGYINFTVQESAIEGFLFLKISVILTIFTK